MFVYIRHNIFNFGFILLRCLQNKNRTHIILSYKRELWITWKNEICDKNVRNSLYLFRTYTSVSVWYYNTYDFITRTQKVMKDWSLYIFARTCAPLLEISSQQQKRDLFTNGGDLLKNKRGAVWFGLFINLKFQPWLMVNKSR